MSGVHPGVRDWVQEEGRTIPGGSPEVLLQGPGHTGGIGQSNPTTECLQPMLRMAALLTLRFYSHRKLGRHLRFNNHLEGIVLINLINTFFFKKVKTPICLVVHVKLP